MNSKFTEHFHFSVLQHFPFLFDAFVHHILLIHCNSMTYPAAPYLWFFISLLSQISASQSGNYSILDLNIQSHQLHRDTSAQPNITSEPSITHTYLKFPSTHTIISKSDLKLPLCPDTNTTWEIYNRLESLLSIIKQGGSKNTRSKTS